MKAPTRTEAEAPQQATAQAARDAALKEKEANSHRFYTAKHDLFFCNEVVKLAAFASAMQRSLQHIEDAASIYPGELEKVKGTGHGVNDWTEMPTEALHWALNLAAQRIQDASEAMETAFMAAERQGNGGHHAQ